MTERDILAGFRCPFRITVRLIGKLYKFILSVAIELCRETKFVNENVPWGLRFAS